MASLAVLRTVTWQAGSGAGGSVRGGIPPMQGPNEWSRPASTARRRCSMPSCTVKARALQVPVALEVSRSGVGAHTWVFFTSRSPPISQQRSVRAGTAWSSQTGPATCKGSQRPSVPSGPNRAPYDGKVTAEVHDYHDELTGVLASSLAERAPGYTSRRPASDPSRPVTPAIRSPAKPTMPFRHMPTVTPPCPARRRHNTDLPPIPRLLTTASKMTWPMVRIRPVSLRSS